MPYDDLPAWEHEFGNLALRVVAAESLSRGKKINFAMLDIELLRLLSDAENVYERFKPGLDLETQKSFVLLLERLNALLQRHKH